VRDQGADEPLDRGRAGARSRWLDDGIKRGLGQRPEALVDFVNGGGQIVAFPSVLLRILPSAIDMQDDIAVGRLHMEKKGG